MLKKIFVVLSLALVGSVYCAPLKKKIAMKINVEMRKFYQNKLWRDKAPERLEKLGSIINKKELNDQEYDHQLRLKLKEEADEVAVAKSPHELAEEIADVLEVIDALCALHDLSINDIKAIQAAKCNERGGFYDRVFVTTAEHPVDSYGDKYCLAQPDKYPQIK